MNLMMAEPWELTSSFLDFGLTIWNGNIKRARSTAAQISSLLRNFLATERKHSSLTCKYLVSKLPHLPNPEARINDLNPLL
jgi:hypothetical protein